MDVLLHQKLTAQRVGCTQEHIELFLGAEIFTIEDIKGLTEDDLKEIGLKLGTRRRVMAEFGLQGAAAIGGSTTSERKPPVQTSIAQFAVRPPASIASSGVSCDLLRTRVMATPVRCRKHA